jgi:hypothetical protein
VRSRESRADEEQRGRWGAHGQPKRLATPCRRSCLRTAYSVAWNLPPAPRACEWLCMPAIRQQTQSRERCAPQGRDTAQLTAQWPPKREGFRLRSIPLHAPCLPFLLPPASPLPPSSPFPVPPAVVSSGTPSCGQPRHQPHHPIATRARRGPTTTAQERQHQQKQTERRAGPGMLEIALLDYYLFCFRGSALRILDERSYQRRKVMRHPGGHSMAEVSKAYVFAVAGKMHLNESSFALFSLRGFCYL